nr:THO complex subunit putative [Albugo laibachii Nc14]|eukprot:CCA22483.1 THO complex subunit putative [Albugo laibachii Nc14]
MQQELQTQQPALPSPKLIESTQNIFDIAIQRIVARLSWNLVTGSVQPDTTGIPALLDLCIDGAIANILFQFAPYKVLEDVMESQPIQTCEALWDILEVRKTRLTASPFFDTSGRTTKSSLTLLRMCNAMLRRLSKTHNTVFCGRILVFLSFTFTLNERSAVNLHSKANVENLTIFEDQNTFEAAEADEKTNRNENDDALSKEDCQDDGMSEQIDYKLYHIFWDVQRFFRDYSLAASSVMDKKTFLEELNMVLTAFEANAFSDEDTTRSSDLNRTVSKSTVSSASKMSIDKIMHDDNSTDKLQEHFFQPKYLTNSRLFRLQLRDPTLRECVLTQALILLSHLVRAKSTVSQDSTQKSEMVEAYDRVMKLLKRTPPDGAGYSEMVASVLERERNWTKWKEERCPSYEKYPDSSEKLLGSSKRSNEAATEHSGEKKRVMRKKNALESGLMDQILESDASRSSTLLEKIKGESRATNIALPKLMDRFTEAWDPASGIDKEYWPDQDEIYCWRTLRQGMKTHVMYLDHAIDGAGAVVKAILGIETLAEPAKVADDAMIFDDNQEKSSESPQAKRLESANLQSTWIQDIECESW